jgi:hypothetical protein
MEIFGKASTYYRLEPLFATGNSTSFMPPPATRMPILIHGIDLDLMLSLCCFARAGQFAAHSADMTAMTMLTS